MPPRPTRIYERERLFHLLDGVRRDHRVIWVSAPAGAGKTSLAASYVAARKLPILWYQVDEGDGDVASFFYYMGLAAKRAAPRHKVPLPVLSPEYLLDLPTFARNYFRTLYARLSKDALIVLDNYQDAPEASALHDVLNIAMQEVPSNLNLLVLSRVEPPAVLARLRLGDHAVCLDWARIQLTREETAGIGAIRLGDKALDSQTLDALHERAQGWAAGVVLMLEQNRDGAPPDPAPAATGQKLLFDYFAGELLARAEPTTQEFLLKTALFPKFSAHTARSLTGLEQAQAILDELTRRNYFTVRQVGAGGDTFEYHPLFREFLLTRLCDTFSPADRMSLQHRGAQLLEKAGYVEDAVDLYRQATDWENLTRLLLTAAPALAMQARYQTLERWLSRLPPSLIEQEPWLLYWRGLCQLPLRPGDARRELEKSYAGFEKRDDPTGLYLSWSAITDSFYFEWTDFRPVDRWIAALELLRARHPSFPSPEVEARVVLSAVAALSNRYLNHADLPYWVERAETLLASVTDPGQRGPMVSQLVLYFLWMGWSDRARKTLGEIESTTKDQSASPLSRLLVYLMLSTYSWYYEDPRTALRLAEEALRIAEVHGISVWKLNCLGMAVHACLVRGDPDYAAGILERMSSLMNGRGRLDLGWYQHLASMICVHRGDLAAAATHADEALRLSRQSGLLIAEASALFMSAIVAFMRGDARAAEHLAATRAIGEEKQSKLIVYACRVIEIAWARDSGHASYSSELLREIFKMSREMNGPALPWLPHSALARLYAAALEHGIERDHVRSLIRRFEVAAPEGVSSLDSWPWPVKIYTLGRFSVLLDDKPLKFSTKAQKKPLELLKALIALGGRGVAAATLAQALWPDAEGDIAQRTLDTTLHRLRKLLGDGANLTLQDGQLTLNPSTCWVDVWALERMLRPEKDGSLLSAQIEKALALYQGPFLGKDEAAWALALRERVRSKFLRALTHHGRTLEAATQWEAAAEWYQKGIEVDHLAEELYRRLMLSYHKLNRGAEALAVYRRCTQALRSVLGVEPAPETQALYKEIQGAMP